MMQPVKNMLRATVGFLERIAQWDEESIVLYLRAVVAALSPILVHVIGSQVAELYDGVRSHRRVVVDQAALWQTVAAGILVCVLVLIMVVSYLLKSVSIENRIVLVLQMAFFFFVVEYCSPNSNFTSLTLVFPLASALFRIPFAVYGSAMIVVVFVHALLFVEEQADFGFRRFRVTPSGSLQALDYAFAALFINVMAFVMSRSINVLDEQNAACDEKLNRIIDALSEVKTNDALELVEAETTRTPLLSALMKLSLSLSRCRPYLPDSLLTQKEAEEFDDETNEDSLASARRVTQALTMDDDTSTAVEMAVHRRRCTVVNVALMNLPTKDILDAADMIRTFAETVIPKVSGEGGVIDHISPTHILIAFNAFTPCVLHERAACRCALAIASELAEYKDILYSIAISSGYNLTGSCGIDTHRAKFVAGEGVDLVFKLPSLMARHLSCSIAVTEDVANSCGCEVAPIDTIEPHWFQEGRSKTITLYELRSSKKETGEASPSVFSAYTVAFTQMRAGELAESLKSLTSYCECNPADFQAARLRGICQRYTKANMRFRGFRKELNFLSVEGTGGAARNSLSMKQSVRDAAVRENLQQTMMQMLQKSQADLELQEDGLVPMFVSAEEEGSTEVPQPSDVDENVPKSFSDTSKDVWQRSDKKIGSGAFSDVYMGLGAQGSLAAMKCFSRTKKSIDQQELVKEVTTLSQLRNDYIVGYVSCAIMPNHFVILMEYVSGGSLRELLDQFGPLPLPAVRRYLKDILRGLQYLHEHGITHCDIKPHNALLSNDGTCKLSDFGSAVNGQNPGTSDGELNVRGTSWYMSPQAARGEIRPSNDIWSVGVTLIELLHGKQPWVFSGGENRFVVALSKDEAMVPPIPADIPPDARIFAESCFKRRFEDRPTAAQLLNSPFLT